MSLNFKNRIAFYYMLATAIIMAVAFLTIYLVVQKTVMTNLDDDLSYEAMKHTGEIVITDNDIRFANKEEWEEREHREVQVNPVFIQLIDRQGDLMDKSPNLKGDVLSFNEAEFGGHFDSKISNRSIRQVQLPIEKDGKIKGYILAAMSSESALSILLKLKNVLLFSYLIVLVGLYFISRLLAGRSIKPVQEVTNTITRISKHNLKDRVELPQHQDEIHDLSTGFNALLDRIEDALERERQFTSDASHELRTPLATLRGTLEVLIRKPRKESEYVEKIGFSLSEIEKMTNTLEQLLLLARLDSNATARDSVLVPLPTVIDDSLTHYKSQVVDKELKIDLHFDPDKKLLVPHYYTYLIINNILGNAIKYSDNSSTIRIVVDEVEGDVVCRIEDHGIGIKKEDLKHIYDSFFRSDALHHKHIGGNGLGLSIVRKCADAIDAKLNIESVVGQGTTVSIRFT